MSIEQNNDQGDSSDVSRMVAEFTAATGVRVRCGVRAATLTTFSIGGPIAVLAEPSTAKEAASAATWLSRAGVSYKILGGGSNLLVSDGGVPGWVLKLGRGLRYYRQDKGVGEKIYFEVGAAMPLMTLSRELCEKGLSGLEFAGGIPASIGGAVKMNAGAHGGDMSRIVESIEVITADGELLSIDADDLDFSYRHSKLPEGSAVLTAVIAMIPGDKNLISRHRSSFLAERKARQPLTMPSAGSIFKNPSPELSAGAVLERAGMKGKAIGGASISDLHANWIVNPKREATSSDVLKIMELCRRTAREHANVELHAELVTW